MALKNYVDRSTPAIAAAWLNAVDLVQLAITAVVNGLTSIGAVLPNGTQGPVGLTVDQAGNVNVPTGTLTTPVFRTTGAAVQGKGPIANAFVDATPDTAQFLMTYKDNAGANVLGSANAVWSRNGNQVTLYFPVATGNAAGTDFTATGLPAAITPGRNQTFGLAPLLSLEDNGAVIAQPAVSVQSNGSVVFAKGGLPAGWTAAGVKGVSTAFSITYILN